MEVGVACFFVGLLAAARALCSSVSASMEKLGSGLVDVFVPPDLGSRRESDGRDSSYGGPVYGL